MAAAVPAIPTAAASLIGGFTAPGPTSGTQYGASDFLRNQYNFTNPQDVYRAYQQGFSSLQGQERRDMGGAATSAAGQAASLGVGNPYAWINHAKGQVGNQYAGQYGDLAKNQAMAQIMQRNENVKNRLQAISMGGR